jgi:Protein of unknown function (DUF3800)
VFRKDEISLTVPDGLIAAGDGAKHFMAFFQVAFDDSGKADKNPAVAYGGAVATSVQWSAVTEEWRGVLERHGLQYFKMAEAMTWFGEFQKKHSEWGPERDAKREALLSELVDVAVRHRVPATGMWTDSRVLNHDRNGEKKLELFKSAALVLLEAVPAGNYVTLMCDEEIEIERGVRAWIRSMRKAHGSVLAPITGVCFMDDRVIPVVQLADMIAWLFRQYGEQVIATDNHATMNPLLLALMHSSHFGLRQTEVGGLLGGLRQFEGPR